MPSSSFQCQHVKPKDKSPLTYSRQAYTSLYGKVLSMFRCMRDGAYDPDLPEIFRVEAGASASARAEGENTVEAETFEANGEAEPSEPSSAESEAAESDEGCQGLRVPFAEPVDERDVFVHRLSGVAHCLKHGGYRKEFFCGRLVSKMYTPFRRSGAAGQDPDCCMQCHRARDRE